MAYHGVCVICSKQFERNLGRPDIEKGKGRYCSRGCYSLSLKGKPSWNKGIPHTKEHIEHWKNSRKVWGGNQWTKKQREAFSLKYRGENSHKWKGGLTATNKLLRRSFEFKEWRKAVFERDIYTCVLCKKTGGELHPDHIKPFADFPELRFELSNGRTLCKPCHMKTSTWGARRKL